MNTRAQKEESMMEAIRLHKTVEKVRKVRKC